MAKPEVQEGAFEFDLAWVWRRRDDGETGVRFDAPAGVTVGLASEYVPVVSCEVAERLAAALDDAADKIAAYAGCNSEAYHDAMRAWHEFRAVFPKAEEA